MNNNVLISSCFSYLRGNAIGHDMLCVPGKSIMFSMQRFGLRANIICQQYRDEWLMRVN